MARVRVGEIDLYVEEVGSGPAILFISGLGSNHRTWRAVLLALSDAYRCVTFDNRDAGASGEAPGAYTIASMAEDAVSVLDALGVARAHVVGASMGGAIAQELALGHPERVERLVLIGTYTSADARGAAILESWLHLQAAVSREAYLRSIFPWLYSVEDYARAGFIEGVLHYQLEDPHPQSIGAYRRQMQAALGHHTVGRLGGIRAPTLVLFGEHDILTPLRFAQSLMAEIPNARFRLFEGTGHALLWTRPTEVAAAIRAFLGE